MMYKLKSSRIIDLDQMISIKKLENNMNKKQIAATFILGMFAGFSMPKVITHIIYLTIIISLIILYFIAK